MRFRAYKLWMALVLLAAVWALDLVRDPGARVWVHPHEAANGPARILRFYASVGTVAPGERVQLCYAVENARTVRISPLFTGLYRTGNQCVDVAPEHTTHFTLMAEGYDGSVAAKSFTLPVQNLPPRATSPVPVKLAGAPDARRRFEARP
jgi:hypothetical protein